MMPLHYMRLRRTSHGRTFGKLESVRLLVSRNRAMVVWCYESKSDRLGPSRLQTGKILRACVIAPKVDTYSAACHGSGHMLASES